MKASQNIFFWRARATSLVLLFIAIFICVGMAMAQSLSSADLQKILTQMDAASAKFHSAQAAFQWDQYEKVVDSTDTQTGTIYFQRTGADTRMAADIETADGQPSKKYLVFDKGTLQFFQPQIDQLTVFHAGNKQGQYETYLTLGFGGSGADLQKNWEITYQGMETIDGIQTAKLDLVSKSPGVRDNFSHITIWVDPARAILLKQIFFEPSGDSKTCYFRKIAYNKPISASVFKIKTDSKTQVVQK